MLCPEFLRKLHSVLREPGASQPGGTFTLVTDCVRYGVSLAESIALLGSEKGGARLFAPVPVIGDSSGMGAPRVHKEFDGIQLFVGIPQRQFVQDPFSAAGHAACESSYFDRLWKNGGGQARYFIILQRK
eukprot:TRINITY_DN31418_c0_g1_i1.p1 TRINITY_DN31418_c0_g1~~TRINITY_DN31418_c0_g1_i1.p1  ORF type:complete len:130 (+),score=23.47 TRINITY_DN31418_c0_g1_i1:271-660(+)